jgi:hypothetical protein
VADRTRNVAIAGDCRSDERDLGVWVFAHWDGNGPEVFATRPDGSRWASQSSFGASGCIKSNALSLDARTEVGVP